MKFRKKPVVVDAVQFTEGPVDDPNAVAYAILEWALPFQPDPVTRLRFRPKARAIYIPTLEGMMRADLGDWIIRGVAGEFYPCKPDIFEQTYEPASADPEAT